MPASSYRRALATRVALLAALSFFASGIPRALTFSAGATLFLDRYGANWLPAIYVASALSVPLAGALLVRAQRLLPMALALSGTLLLDIVMLCGLWIALRLDPEGPAAAVLGLWVYVQWVFTSLAIWAPAAWIFDIRESRRAYGFVAAGGLGAQTAGGFAVPILLGSLSPADLLPIAAAGSAVGLCLLSLIIRLAGTPPPEPNLAVTDGTEPAAGGMTRAIVWLAAFGQVTYYLTENAFFQQAHHRFGGEEELASFLGYVSAAEGAASVGLSLLTTWIIARFGLRGTLLGLPGIVLGGAALSLAGALLLGPYHAGVFWMLTGLYLADCCLRYTLDRSTGLVLYQALTPGSRARVQTRIESMVEPVACGLTGLLLLVGVKFLDFETSPLVGLLIAAAALWGVAALRAFGRFVEACTAQAASGEPDIVSPERRQTILSTLCDADRMEVALAAATGAPGRWGRGSVLAIAAILHNPMTQVRLRPVLLDRLGRIGSDAAAREIQRWTDHEDALVRRAAARALLRLPCRGPVTQIGDVTRARLIEGAARDLSLLLDLRKTLGSDPASGDRSLATALDHEILECRDYLVVLVGLATLDPRLRRIRSAFFGRDARRGSYALEALDNLLPRQEALRLLPLIERRSDAMPEPARRPALLRAVLEAGTGSFSPLTLASIARHCGEARIFDLQDRIDRLAGHPEPILARTARWAASRLSSERQEKLSPGPSWPGACARRST